MEVIALMEGIGYGGGGGGAIEIGAIGRISVGGSISANGSSGSEGGGGGSGGGIFLHGDSVTLSSSGVLSAKAATAAMSVVAAGGGGRVLIEVGTGGFSGDVSSINVSGGGVSNTSGVFPPYPPPPGPLTRTVPPASLPSMSSLSRRAWCFSASVCSACLVVLAMPGVGRPPEPDVPRSCSARCGGPTPPEWPR